MCLLQCARHFISSQQRSVPVCATSDSQAMKLRTSGQDTCPRPHYMAGINPNQTPNPAAIARHQTMSPGRMWDSGKVACWEGKVVYLIHLPTPLALSLPLPAPAVSLQSIPGPTPSHRPPISCSPRDHSALPTSHPVFDLQAQTPCHKGKQQEEPRPCLSLPASLLLPASAFLPSPSSIHASSV